MKLLTLNLLLFFVFLSCKSDPNKQIDEGQIKEGMYHSEEIGWTMQIPVGWKITERDVLQERSEKGLDAMKEAVDIEFDRSGLKQLVNFQKDQFHIFQSTSEPFKLEYEGEWEQNNEGLKQVIYETYTSRGMKIDTSSTKEKIDHLDFDVFHITIYGPDGKVILYQDMYSKYINGHDFGVNLNYLRDEEKKEMLSAWKSSKFK